MNNSNLNSMILTNWHDGVPANIVTLQNKSGMQVSFMDIGATWLSCLLPTKQGLREVLLRSANMTEHQQQSAYFGSIVGRYGNRIDQGAFELNDQHYQLTCNDGSNSLHGGVNGLDKRRWNIESQTQTRVCFSVSSVDGDQGYPGNLDIKICYVLDDDNRLTIDYWAQSDQDCPVNLTNHAYFNLAGENSSAKSTDHYLQLCATHYLPTREDLIPTGEWKNVNGNSFDFQVEKSIGQDFLADQAQQIAGGYDHAFIFEPSVTDGRAIVGRLSAPDSSVSMDIRTTKPAIQFYSGNYLQGTPGASKQYAQFDGIALETQYLPDGPNHLDWAYGYQCLKVGECYQHQTSYQFNV